MVFAFLIPHLACTECRGKHSEQSPKVRRGVQGKWDRCCVHKERCEDPGLENVVPVSLLDHGWNYLVRGFKRQQCPRPLTRWGGTRSFFLFVHSCSVMSYTILYAMSCHVLDGTLDGMPHQPLSVCRHLHHPSITWAPTETIQALPPST